MVVRDVVVEQEVVEDEVVKDKAVENRVMKDKDLKFVSRLEQNEHCAIVDTTAVQDEDRNRQSKKMTQNIQNRARSFERDPNQTSSFTLRRTQSLKRKDNFWTNKIENQNQEEEQISSFKLRRSQSLKRTDRKWENQDEAEGPRQRTAWTRPGKLNNSYWEKRAEGDYSLPTRTPTPRRRLIEKTNETITQIA